MFLESIYKCKNQKENSQKPRSVFRKDCDQQHDDRWKNKWRVMGNFLIIIQRNHLINFYPFLCVSKTLFKKEIRKIPDIISDANQHWLNEQKEEHVLKKNYRNMLLYIVIG